MLADFSQKVQMFFFFFGWVMKQKSFAHIFFWPFITVPLEVSNFQSFSRHRTFDLEGPIAAAAIHTEPRSTSLEAMAVIDGVCGGYAACIR